MAAHITRNGMSISELEMESAGRSVSFFFNVFTPRGVKYVFLYEEDAKGLNGWSMRLDGENEILGRLNPEFTDADIDNLIKKKEDNPDVSVYLLLPGHPASANPPDLVIFEVNKVLVSCLRTFMSFTTQMMNGNNLYISIVNRMAREIPQGMQARIENAENIFWQRVCKRFKANGFFMCPTEDAPQFIKSIIADEPTETMFFERIGKACPAVVNNRNEMLGECRNIEGVFSSYSLISRQYSRVKMTRQSRMVGHSRSPKFRQF